MPTRDEVPDHGGRRLDGTQPTPGRRSYSRATWAGALPAAELFRLRKRRCSRRSIRRACWGDVERALIERCGRRAASNFHNREPVEWPRAASSAHPHARAAAPLAARRAEGAPAKARCVELVQSSSSLGAAGSYARLGSRACLDMLSRLGLLQVAGTWMLAEAEA